MTQGGQPPPPSATPIPSRTGRHLWLWVILAAIALLILLFMSAPDLQNGSTYSRSTKGYRSWYDYMAEQGHPIQRWQKPYPQLQGTNQTLIRIAANIDEQEQDDISSWDDFSDWIKQGNTLIRLTWDGQVSAAPFSSDLMSQAGFVRIETTRRHTLQARQDFELKDSYGGVVWFESLGKGRIIFATYPWIGANIYANQAGNYQFLEQLISTTGPIWMDERLHGHREDENQTATDQRDPENLWLYLAQTPVAAVTVQLGLLAILAIWGHNHRFGLPLRLPKESRDNSQQYIQALAGTLNDAHQRELVLKHLSQYLRQTLAHQLGLKAGSADPLPTDAILAAQWSVATGRNDQELIELLQQAGQMSLRTDRDLLAWVSKADAILQDIP